MAPAGQLWSTVDDLAAFARFLVDGQDDVLCRDSLEEMATPTSATSGLGLCVPYDPAVQSRW